MHIYILTVFIQIFLSLNKEKCKGLVKQIGAKFLLIKNKKILIIDDLLVFIWLM